MPLLQAPRTMQSPIQFQNSESMQIREALMVHGAQQQ